MPEANVLYSVTAAVVVGLVVWVVFVLKTAKQPWARETPALARVDGPLEPVVVEPIAVETSASTVAPPVVDAPAADAAADADADADADAGAKRDEAKA